MAITFSSGVITISGDKDSGTASSGASTTLTDSSKSWTTNAYKEYIVFLTGGTGAGQTRRISSNSSTVLAVDPAWDTQPDATTTYKIGYDAPDIVSALPSNVAWDQNSADRVLIVNTTVTNINVTGSYGSLYTDYNFESDRCTFTSATGSYFQLGYIQSDGSGGGGCTLIMRLSNPPTSYYEAALIGNTYLYASHYIVHKDPLFNDREFRFNNKFAGPSSIDGVDVRDCRFTGCAFCVRENDIFERNITENKVFFALEGECSSFSGNMINSSSINPTSVTNGLNVYNLEFIGDTDASFSVREKPIFVNSASWTNVANSKLYLIDPVFQGGNIPYSSSIKWQGSFTTNQRIYFCREINIKTVDAALANLGSVNIRLVDTNGDAAWTASKSGTDYTPVKSEVLVSDVNGDYADVLVVTEDQYSGTHTTYRPFLLTARKYGYLEQFEFARDYKVSQTDQITMQVNNFVVATASVAGAYTGISIDGAAQTITLTASRDVQEIYDYAQWWMVQSANMQYAAPLATADGNSFSLPDNWKVILAASGNITGTTGKTFSFSGTGELVLQDAANNVDGLTITGDMSIDAAVGTMDGVTISGTLDYSVTGSYDIDDCAINIVTASVPVTLNIDATTTITDSTDPDVTVVSPTGQIDFTNLISGSQIVVCNTGTQTEVYRNNSTSTSETTGALTSGTYDYTIRKADYFEIRVTGVVIGSSPIPVQAQQEFDRAYVASSGLTFGTTATINTTTKEFAVTTATTVQNWYSFWKEAFIAEPSLVNIAMPLRTFGSASFSLADDYEFTSASLQYLSRDGFRYEDSSGTRTAGYCAVLSQGVTAGLQVEYQQASGAAPTDTQNTGNIDQVIQFFGDATHGSFDYSGYLKLKVQANGYREARADLVDTFGTIEETLYVAGLATVAIDGLTLGDPAATGITITKEATPVSYDAGDGAKNYSITILDSGTNSAESILRELNYNLAQDATYQGLEPFDWPEMVVKNGSNYETARGIVESDGTPTFHGVFVTRDGTNPHPDFTRFQADDGTYGVVPVFANISITGMSTGGTNTRLQIYNVTTASMYYDDDPGASSYNDSYTDGVGFTGGDTYRIRYASMNAGTSFETFEITGIAATSGFSVSISPDVDAVYVANAIDGGSAAVTGKFTANFTNDYIVCDTNQDFTNPEAYAYYCYELTTTQGMQEFWGGVTAIDVGNYRNNTSVVSIFFDETAGFVKQTDNSRFFRDDGLRPAIDPTTGGNGIEINWKNPVYVQNIGGSTLLADERSALLATAKEATLQTIRSASGTGANVTEVSGTAVASVDDFKASALDQATFDTRMANVPGATKDTYKADVSGKADASELAIVKSNQNIINTNVKEGSTYPVKGGPDTA